MKPYKPVRKGTGLLACRNTMSELVNEEVVRKPVGAEERMV